jgi:hypothetical protein
MFIGLGPDPTILLCCSRQLREDADGRFIATGEVAKQAGLPDRLRYRFDGKDLILTILEGEAKGEYRLVRAKSK